MNKRLALPMLWLICAAQLLAQASAPAADMISDKAALERLLSAEQAEADWFAESFLKSVPLPQVHALLAQHISSQGAYQEVRKEKGGFLAVYERGVVPTKIHLDGSGRIDGLFFSLPQSRGGTVDELVAQMKLLSGKVSLLVLEGDTPRAEALADEPLAVGSAFKVAVLKALKQQVETGKATWDQVLPLHEDLKSLPTGILQTWPAGTPLTLSTLASLMISQSDNTATDHLIHFVTPAALEEMSPRNAPFLTTRQLFHLKSKANAQLSERFRGAETATRRSILEELAQQGAPNAADFIATSVTTDIEWFYTARELCDLMNQVRDLPLMSINPGLAKPENWKRVAFKGGSEPGVLCLVTWVEAQDGRKFTIAATWNNDVALDETKFYTLYGDLLEKLRAQK